MALFFKAPLGAVSAGSAFSHPNDLAYSLGLLARWTSGHTKAQDVEPARRHVDVAKRRQAEPGGVVPAATPGTPGGSPFWLPLDLSQDLSNVVRSNPETIPKRFRACRTGPKRLVSFYQSDESCRLSYRCTRRSRQV